MKHSIIKTEIYPHPPERVYRALTDREALAAWLMPNDFEAKVGHHFTFRTDPAPGFDGIVRCEVLELDPPRRVAYSWRGGPLDTVVRFTLEPVPGGTRLRFEHTGFEGVRPLLISLLMRSGWKKMFRRLLPAVLDRFAHGEAAGTGLSCEADRTRLDAAVTKILEKLPS